MRLERLAPVPQTLEISGYEELRLIFAAREWRAPSFLLNIVADAQGRFTGDAGSSRDISNEADYQSLIGYRMAADGILTSAGTARSEQYRRSRMAPLALASKSGDFSGIPAVELESAGPVDSLVYLLVKRSQVRRVRARYTQPWVRVVSVGRGNPFGLTFRLTRLGWRRILVEAGPSYANWLLANAIIAGIALTVVGVESDSPLNAAKPALDALGVTGAQLESAEILDGTLFTRWSEISAVKRF